MEELLRSDGWKRQGQGESLCRGPESNTSSSRNETKVDKVNEWNESIRRQLANVFCLCADSAKLTAQLRNNFFSLSFDLTFAFECE